MFINRDYNRTEHDDFVLNIQSRLTNENEAYPIYSNGQLIGWKIQSRFE